MRPGAEDQHTEHSWYDPQVEFLEIGVAVRNGRAAEWERAWKIYGPEEHGAYGGVGGLGGLESIIVQGGGAVGMLNDSFGNTVAHVTRTGAQTATTNWSETLLSAYGPTPTASNKATITYLTTADTLASATLWRGKRMDPTGFYYLGTRYYEPGQGRFLSPDPLGHSATADLYSFADGDPVNLFDPDGRQCLSPWGGLLQYNRCWSRSR